MDTKTKYYSNLYLIEDKNRKIKLQELFLRSLNTDMDKWTKTIKYNIDEDEKTPTTATKYFSPSYSGYIFQLDYDKKIGMVHSNGKIFELVFDYEDYENDKYPKDIREPLIQLMKTVFVDSIKKIDTIMPKSQSEVGSDLRNSRSEKLEELWGKTHK